jgi:hypothetical protein
MLNATLPFLKCIPYEIDKKIENVIEINTLKSMNESQDLLLSKPRAQ